VLVISYGSRELARLCSKHELALATYGASDGSALLELIAEAEALETVADLIAFRGAIVAEKKDSLSVDISPNYRATFILAGDEVPRSQEGEPIWEQVRRLQLVGIDRL
jgi:hypothetical protein